MAFEINYWLRAGGKAPGGIPMPISGTSWKSRMVRSWKSSHSSLSPWTRITSMAPCSGSRKRNRSAGRRKGTESLGRLKEEQLKVGPQGAASGPMQVIGCRRQARRALQVGRPANQIARKFDEIVEFSGCAREQADTGYESRVASENAVVAGPT